MTESVSKRQRVKLTDSLTVLVREKLVIYEEKHSLS
ncbi:hypothetical protein K227x_36110 [Rubripirellula lacrimiformis]|uniref:Uncharacterized protein n=1 Tax=Rubripirellula lacrimiformis TaxID=1930273 RepID=A0A517NDL9_9BACT|nr:hypothetical protein K227x_36110 [Rubripirellula lacrimiformis]